MFMNSLKIVKVDWTQDPSQGKKDHAKMYVPTLVRTAPGPEGRASVTMALPDSGNLLAHAAIDAKFHQQLGVPVEWNGMYIFHVSIKIIHLINAKHGITYH